jgi:succinoglycan biosynthesis transport protein ExoP
MIDVAKLHIAQVAKVVEPTWVEPVDTKARRIPFRTATSREAEESYRKAALFLSKMARDGRRSVVFCSAQDHEGTTTAVLSLAHQLQENFGLRPLIIELNRRRPALTRLFKLDPQRSLDNAVTQAKPASECIQVTPSGLHVIAGARALTPDPQLATALQRVVSELEHAFDLILIDAPPVLAQADAIIAGSVVPRVVLVVEAGRANYHVLERVKRELATEDIKIAGTVLTKHKRFVPRWLYWWLTR